LPGTFTITQDPQRNSSIINSAIARYLGIIFPITTGINTTQFRNLTVLDIAIGNYILSSEFVFNSYMQDFTKRLSVIFFRSRERYPLFCSRRELRLTNQYWWRCSNLKYYCMGRIERSRDVCAACSVSSAFDTSTRWINYNNDNSR
jgi:hypothetical protein